MKKPAALCIVIISLILLPSSLLAALTCDTNVQAGDKIQDAINNAIAGEVICIGVGTYEENLLINADITLQGEELARTIIDGRGTGTVISGADGALINNVTVRNGQTGIAVQNVPGFTVTNVIVVNNETGVNSNNSAITLENVVISLNTTGISGDALSVITLTNSIVFSNTTAIVGNSPTNNTSLIDVDPLFVILDVDNPDLNDYHLKADSPAIDAGTGTDPDGLVADIGAYGGPDADIRPFPVSGLDASSPGIDSVTLTWSANEAYNISGYKIYFDVDQSGSPYDGVSDLGPSPITPNPPDATSFTVTGLTVSGTTLEPTLTAPIGLSTMPGFEKLLTFWSPVAGATGYELSYGTTSGSLATTVDVGNNTSYTIGNLTNNVTYYVAVRAYWRPVYYFAVSAYIESPSFIESALINEVQAELTAQTDGPLSAEVSDFPEDIRPFPRLEDESKCFIATAAYGSSMEREVVVLRKFRNHFLLTSSSGRKLVALYYRYSPPLAEYIENHKWLRPVVRAGLYPVAGLAGLCLRARPMPVFVWPGVLAAAFFLTIMLIRNIRRP